MSKDYYAGGARISRDGVPCRVAPWVRELTDGGQKMVMSEGTFRRYRTPNPFLMKSAGWISQSTERALRDLARAQEMPASVRKLAKEQLEERGLAVAA